MKTGFTDDKFKDNKFKNVLGNGYSSHKVVNVLTCQEPMSFVGVGKNVIGEDGRMKNIGSSDMTKA